MFQVSEAREGVVVRTILDTGEYILPLRHEKVIPSKPILFHWLSVGMVEASGVYNEFVLRLPSALAAIALCAVVFGTVGSLVGPTGGLYSVLVMLSTYSFMHLAADGRVDMLFSFFVGSAICLWLVRAAESFELEKKGANISSRSSISISLLCGLAILTKGPLGLVLPLVCIAGISLAVWGVRGLRSLVRYEWLFALAVGLPWYYFAASLGESAFVARQVVFENITRFFGGAGVSSKPFWFYLVHLWSQAAPWSLVILLLAVKMSLRGGDSRFSKLCDELATANSKKEQFLLRSSVVWFVVGLLFFSFSVGKRRAYLLPLMPALAMIVGCYLLRLEHWCIENRGEFQRFVSLYVRKIGLTFWLLLPTLLCCSIAYLYFFRFPNLHCSDCQVTISGATLILSDHLVSLAGLGLAVLFGSYFLCQSGLSEGAPARLIVGGLLYLQVVFAVLIPAGLAVKGVTHTYKYFAKKVTIELSQARSELVFLKRQGDESFDGFFFYYSMPLQVTNSDDFSLLPGKIYLARREELERYNPRWSETAKIILSGGRLVDRVGEELVLFASVK